MKKIMILLILGMICIPCLGAQLEENKGFGYGNLGSIGGYPTLGGGYRMQYEYQGFDISGKCTPWIPATTAAEIRGLYLLYPMQKGIYLGAGCGYLWAIESLPRGSVTFDAVVGYQWETAKGRKLFCQIEAITAVEESCCDRTTPAITFGIGF